ncbi:arsenite translocating ATPase [Gracilaria domingensis]|nr:arsenite translocating ATPase [Gracilaria domingensis]
MRAPCARSVGSTNLVLPSTRFGLLSYQLGTTKYEIWPSVVPTWYDRRSPSWYDRRPHLAPQFRRRAAPPPPTAHRHDERAVRAADGAAARARARAARRATDGAGHSARVWAARQGRAARADGGAGAGGDEEGGRAAMGARAPVSGGGASVAVSGADSALDRRAGAGRRRRRGQGRGRGTCGGYGGAAAAGRRGSGRGDCGRGGEGVEAARGAESTRDEGGGAGPAGQHGAQVHHRGRQGRREQDVHVGGSGDGVCGPRADDADCVDGPRALAVGRVWTERVGRGRGAGDGHRQPVRAGGKSGLDEGYVQDDAADGWRVGHGGDGAGQPQLAVRDDPARAVPRTFPASAMLLQSSAPRRIGVPLLPPLPGFTKHSGHGTQEIILAQVVKALEDF